MKISNLAASQSDSINASFFNGELDYSELLPNQIPFFTNFALQPLPFTRLHANILQRGREIPTAIGWYTWRDGRLEAISYQVLGACIFAVTKLLSQRDRIVVTHRKNSVAWMAIDMACNASHRIHAPIDPRLDRNIALTMAEKLNSDLQFNDRAELQSERLIDRANQILRDNSVDFELFLSEQLWHFDCTRRSSADLAADTAVAAQILFTSGSCDEPKAVVLTHGNLLQNAAGKLIAMPQYSSDCRLNLLPFAHAYARTCELSTWALAGGSIACARNLSELFALANQLKPTLFNAVPSVLERLQVEQASRNEFNQASFLGGNLRMVASGGAPLSPKTFAAYQAIGLPVHQGYGLTETSPVVCSSVFGKCHDNSIGQPIPGVEVRVDGSQQLWVRGSGVMQGYFNDTAATQARIVEGWLATGDLAEQLTNGNWRIVGRLDERMTLANGYKVDPQPMERKLAAAAEGLGLCATIFILSHEEQLGWLAISDEEKIAECLRPTLQKIPSHIRPRWFYRIGTVEAEKYDLKSFKGNWKRRRIKALVQELLS